MSIASSQFADQVVPKYLSAVGHSRRPVEHLVRTTSAGDGFVAARRDSPRRRMTRKWSIL